MVSKNNFDLIRIVAATQVALVHASEHLHVLPRLADILMFIPGVPIFFFVSGYLITRSWNNATSTSVFFTNRTLRIYPALVACFVLCLVVLFSIGELNLEVLRLQQFWLWCLAQLSVAQFYNPDFLRNFGVGALNGSLWTISVELQFYLIAPIVLSVLGKRIFSWSITLIFFIAANVGFQYFGGGSSLLWKLAGVSFLPWFYMFLTGACFAVFPVHAILKLMLGAPLWQGCILIGAVSAIAILIGAPIVGNTINPVSFFCLAYLVFKLAFTLPSLSGRILAGNDISYGFYIYHMPIINVMLYYDLQGSIAFYLAAIGSTAVLAALSWKLIEQPCIRLKPSSIYIH